VIQTWLRFWKEYGDVLLIGAEFGQSEANLRMMCTTKLSRSMHEISLVTHYERAPKVPPAASSFTHSGRTLRVGGEGHTCRVGCELVQIG
jgi:hypothetical protein